MTVEAGDGTSVLLKRAVRDLQHVFPELVSSVLASFSRVDHPPVVAVIINQWL